MDPITPGQGPWKSILPPSNKYSSYQLSCKALNPQRTQFLFTDNNPTTHPRIRGQDAARQLVLRHARMIEMILQTFCLYTKNSMQALIICLRLNKTFHATIKHSVVLQKGLFLGDSAVTGRRGEPLLNPIYFKGDDPDEPVVMVLGRPHELTVAGQKKLGQRGPVTFHGFVDQDGDQEMGNGDTKPGPEPQPEPEPVEKMDIDEGRHQIPPARETGDEETDSAQARP